MDVYKKDREIDFDKNTSFKNAVSGAVAKAITGQNNTVLSADLSKCKKKIVEEHTKSQSKIKEYRENFARLKESRAEVVGQLKEKTEQYEKDVVQRQGTSSPSIPQVQRILRELNIPEVVERAITSSNNNATSTELGNCKQTIINYKSDIAEHLSTVEKVKKTNATLIKRLQEKTTRYQKDMGIINKTKSLVDRLSTSSTSIPPDVQFILQGFANINRENISKRVEDLITSFTAAITSFEKTLGEAQQLKAEKRELSDAVGDGGAIGEERSLKDRIIQTRKDLEDQGSNYKVLAVKANSLERELDTANRYNIEEFKKVLINLENLSGTAKTKGRHDIPESAMKAGKYAGVTEDQMSRLTFASPQSERWGFPFIKTKLGSTLFKGTPRRQAQDSAHKGTTSGTSRKSPSTDCWHRFFLSPGRDQPQSPTGSLAPSEDENNDLSPLQKEIESMGDGQSGGFEKVMAAINEPNIMNEGDYIVAALQNMISSVYEDPTTLDEVVDAKVIDNQTVSDMRPVASGETSIEKVTLLDEFKYLIQNKTENQTRAYMELMSPTKKGESEAAYPRDAFDDYEKERPVTTNRGEKMNLSETLVFTVFGAVRRKFVDEETDYGFKTDIEPNVHLFLSLVYKYGLDRDPRLDDAVGSSSGFNLPSLFLWNP